MWQIRPKLPISVLVISALLLPVAGGIMRASFPAAAEAVSLVVMTFNLRYASPKPPNSWPERRPVMRNCIRRAAPDLIGTQEGLYDQLKDLAADLPEYEWIGLGREGGNRGEFMAVFYLRARFEPLASDHFWLSDTPSVVGSSTWGNTNRRMVTWVRFRERTSGREFFFWNTHLDNDVELARQKGAALIVERVNQLKTDLPVLLTGDFNSTAGAGKAYEILVQNGGFADTWQLARERENEKMNTFHGFRKPVERSERIDWILARGSVKVDRTSIITDSENGQAPSDHFPVVASLSLEWPAAAPGDVKAIQGLWTRSGRTYLIEGNRATIVNAGSMLKTTVSPGIEVMRNITKTGMNTWSVEVLWQSGAEQKWSAGTLTLSPDGNTLTREGPSPWNNVPEAVVFRRQ